MNRREADQCLLLPEHFRWVNPRHSPDGLSHRDNDCAEQASHADCQGKRLRRGHTEQDVTKSVPAGQREWHTDDEANHRRDKRVPTQQSCNIRRARAEREANRALLTSLIGCPSTSRV